MHAQEQIVRRELPLKWVIWLLPIVFLIHDVEELILIESWWERNGGAVAEKLMMEIGVIWTTPRFAFAVAVLLGVILYACAVSAKDRRLFLIVMTVMFLNVFTHAAQSLLLRMYTPGLGTALGFVLPYTLYSFKRLLREGWIRATDFRNMLVIAGIILLSGFAGSWLL